MREEVPLIVLHYASFGSKAKIIHLLTTSSTSCPVPSSTYNAHRDHHEAGLPYTGLRASGLCLSLRIDRFRRWIDVAYEVSLASSSLLATARSYLLLHSVIQPPPGSRRDGPKPPSPRFSPHKPNQSSGPSDDVLDTPSSLDPLMIGRVHKRALSLGY